MSEKIRGLEDYGKPTAEERANALLRAVRHKFEDTIVPGMIEAGKPKPEDIDLFLVTNRYSPEFPDPILIATGRQIERLDRLEQRDVRFILIDASQKDISIDVELEPVPAAQFLEQLREDPFCSNRQTIRLYESANGPLIDGLAIGLVETIDGLAPSEPGTLDRVEPIIRNLQLAPFII